MTRTGGGWNRGIKVGQKRPFSAEQISIIRYAMQAQGASLRDVALFETALSTMLRSSDLLSLTVGHVLDGDGVVESFEWRQKKSKRGVTVHLSKRARDALRDYLAEVGDCPLTRNLWLTNGRKLSRIGYANIIKGWAVLAHLDPKHYGTHSMRRTMAAHIFEETKDHETVRQLLGHASISSTSAYLNVSSGKAIAIKKRFEL
jgi:site-specific recombinase XerD